MCKSQRDAYFNCQSPSVASSIMGSSIAKAREQKEAKQAQMQEQLQILEKMVDGHLDKKHHSIIAGERGDQEIHSGTVVAEFKQINIG